MTEPSKLQDLSRLSLLLLSSTSLGLPSWRSMICPEEYACTQRAGAGVSGGRRVGGAGGSIHSVGVAGPRPARARGCFSQRRAGRLWRVRLGHAVHW